MTSEYGHCTAIWISQARSQAGAMGATAPSAGPIALSGASLGTLCTWRQVMLYRSAQATDILVPRWQQLRAPEAMPYRSAQITDNLLPRWHQQRAPEVMLYRSAQATDIVPRWQLVACA